MHAQHSAPTPDLRIIPVQHLHPHEEHDSQRSAPLVEALRQAEVLVNPPIVTPLSDEAYVILDGANRCTAFAQLGYPHMLAQVAHYDSGQVELDVWHHIISRWDTEALLAHIDAIPDVALVSGHQSEALLHLMLRDERTVAIMTKADDMVLRNALLRQIVSSYQQNAVLDRTAINQPHLVLPLYPEAVALAVFPRYAPVDILNAAQSHAYLPPGISRHIIQGRAVQVKYPLDVLRDITTTLDEQNTQLQEWVQRKFARRQVRYYAEATYQFDE
ncbi:MAG: hypothetical protein H7Y11_01320 [Armatimonadetes bacterium]|nr:hypothetical protein [Anaerolineae bacterium]